jgi:hypothetical protein
MSTSLRHESHVRMDVRTCADFGTRVGSVISAPVHSHLKSLDPLVTEDKFDVLSDARVRYTGKHCESTRTTSASRQTERSK